MLAEFASLEDRNRRIQIDGDNKKFHINMNSNANGCTAY